VSTPRVGVCSIAFKKLPIGDALQAIADSGADVVELWAQPPHLSYPVDIGECERLRDAAAAVGLSFCALGSYYRPGSRTRYGDQEVTIANQVAATVALGAPILRVWPGNQGYDAAPPELRARVYDETRACADAAAEAGLLVVLERHSDSLTQGWHAPRQVLAEVDHPAVFLNYQVPYPEQQAELRARAVEDYERLLPACRHAHLQNYIASDTTRPPRALIAEGVVDYGRLGAAARACGYDGCFMVEFAADARRGMTAAQAIQADVAGIRRLLSE
jgi:sugar phosphate isomerase/epimerase